MRKTEWRQTTGQKSKKERKTMKKREKEEEQEQEIEDKIEDKSKLRENKQSEQMQSQDVSNNDNEIKDQPRKMKIKTFEGTYHKELEQVIREKKLKLMRRTRNYKRIQRELQKKKQIIKERLEQQYEKMFRQRQEKLKQLERKENKMKISMFQQIQISAREVASYSSIFKKQEKQQEFYRLELLKNLWQSYYNKLQQVVNSEDYQQLKTKFEYVQRTLQSIFLQNPPADSSYRVFRTNYEHQGKINLRLELFQILLEDSEEYISFYGDERQVMGCLAVKESLLLKSDIIKKELNGVVQTIKNSWFVKEKLYRFLLNGPLILNQQCKSFQEIKKYVDSKVNSIQVYFIDYHHSQKKSFTYSKNSQAIFINLLPFFDPKLFRIEMLQSFVMFTLLHEIPYCLSKSKKTFQSLEESFSDEQQYLDSKMDAGFLFEQYLFSKKIRSYCDYDYLRSFHLLQHTMKPEGFDESFLDKVVTYEKPQELPQKSLPLQIVLEIKALRKRVGQKIQQFQSLIIHQKVQLQCPQIRHQNQLLIGQYLKLYQNNQNSLSKEFKQNLISRCMRRDTKKMITDFMNQGKNKKLRMIGGQKALSARIKDSNSKNESQSQDEILCSHLWRPRRFRSVICC